MSYPKPETVVPPAEAEPDMFDDAEIIRECLNQTSASSLNHIELLITAAVAILERVGGVVARNVEALRLIGGAA